MLVCLFVLCKYIGFNEWYLHVKYNMQLLKLNLNEIQKMIEAVKFNYYYNDDKKK